MSEPLRKALHAAASRMPRKPYPPIGSVEWCKHQKCPCCNRCLNCGKEIR